MKKILLVEDDALLNKMPTYNLISEGCDTVSALNAGTATQLLTQTEYDLVLLDINLPDGSGYDLCRLIIFIQHFTATDKHFTAIKLFWHFRQAIIKCLSMAAAKVYLLPLAI